MAAFRFDLKCIAHPAAGGTPLLNRIDGLEAYPNIIRLDMSSRDSGALERNLLFLGQLLVKIILLPHPPFCIHYH